MALLNFPSNPVSGQTYPVAPAVGQNQYEYEASTQTWRLLGVTTGVTAGTYGDAANVGQFTVDTQGRLSSAVNVPISSSAGGTVTSVATGDPYVTGLTGGPITSSGTLSLSDTFVIAGSYGGATGINFPYFDVDAQGRLTTAGSFDIRTATGTELGIVTVDGVTIGVDLNGMLSWVSNVVNAPSTSTDTGYFGQLAADSNYFYWYDGSAWQRVAKDTTPW